MGRLSRGSICGTLPQINAAVTALGHRMGADGPGDGPLVHAFELALRVRNADSRDLLQLGVILLRQMADPGIRRRVDVMVGVVHPVRQPHLIHVDTASS